MTHIMNSYFNKNIKSKQSLLSAYSPTSSCIDKEVKVRKKKKIQVQISMEWRDQVTNGGVQDPVHAVHV